MVCVRCAAQKVKCSQNMGKAEFGSTSVGDLVSAVQALTEVIAARSAAEEERWEWMKKELGRP
jgi:hypothetical protein